MFTFGEMVVVEARKQATQLVQFKGILIVSFMLIHLHHDFLSKRDHCFHGLKGTIEST